MSENLTLAAKIFCKWLKWHRPMPHYRSWYHDGKVWTVCRRCLHIVETEDIRSIAHAAMSRLDDQE